MKRSLTHGLFITSFLFIFCAGLTLLSPNSVIAQVQNEDYTLTTSDEISESYGSDVAIEGDTIVVGELGDSDNGPYSGAVYVYKPDIDGNYSETKLRAPTSNQYFGWSVDIENGVVVVGAVTANTGAVYVYKPDGSGGYLETTLTPSDGSTADYFGHSVTISNGTIIVGAPYHKVNGVMSGMVYVYKPNNNGGYDETKIIPPDFVLGSFGYSVDSSNGTFVVGDWTKSTTAGLRAGKAYVYKPDNSGGYTVTTLTASDGVAEDYFGISIAIKNDVIVVGSIFSDNPFNGVGALYVYKPNNNGGYDETKIQASDGRESGHLGFAVDISEDGTIISTVVRDEALSFGAAYVYKPNNNGGYDETKLVPSNRYQDDRFGYSVALFSNLAAVAWPANESVLLFDIQSNLAPVLEPLIDRIISENESLIFTLIATDLDNNNIAFSAENLPPGATLDPNTGEFSWTPSFDDSGEYEITFIASEDTPELLSDSATITISVLNFNNPPEFNPISDQNVIESNTLEFIVSANDYENNNIIFSAENLPPGATLDPNTGEFSWIPTEAGVYTVTLIATDDGVPTTDSGYIDVVITVGDNPTPVEQAEDLIEVVVTLDLPQNVENSYLANLQKVGQFIEEGKLTPAINQLNAFINKITQDRNQGILTQAEYEALLEMAEGLVEDLES